MVTPRFEIVERDQVMVNPTFHHLRLKLFGNPTALRQYYKYWVHP